MNKLEARILKLEEAQKRVEDRPLLMLIHYCSSKSDEDGYGELIGVRINDTLTERLPGESIESLIDRAGAGLSGLVNVYEVREKGSYVPPVATVTESKPEESKPEPVAPRVIPRPAPKAEVIILGSVERQHGHGSPWGFMA
jgi:hypothetical protein